MNTEAILDLAEFIEGLAHLDLQTNIESEVPPGRWFRMDIWLFQTLHEFDCGTIGCIAGWAAWHWDLAVKQDTGFMVDSKQIGKILGLSRDQSTQLFTPRSLYGVGYRNMTPYMAGKVLRYLAEHEVVDWSVIRYCSACGGELDIGWHGQCGE